MKTGEIEIKIIQTDEVLPNWSPHLLKGHNFIWGNPRKTNSVIICDQCVIRKTKIFSQSTNREVGGILVGDAFQNEGQIYIHIVDFIPAPVFSVEQSSSVHFNFTPDTWLEMLTIKDKHFDHLRVVGWFHSHPNHGVFLSSLDMQIQEGHFTSIWHTAMVYDPIRNEGGFFIWADNKVVESSGFIELSNQSSNESIVTWKNFQMQKCLEPNEKPELIRIRNSQRAMNIFSVSMVIMTAIFMILGINSINNFRLMIQEYDQRMDLLNVQVQELLTFENTLCSQEKASDNSEENDKIIDHKINGLRNEVKEVVPFESFQNDQVIDFLEDECIPQKDLGLFDTDFIR